jgi:DNA-binding transcriptional MerR regulator/methylmalonyl-CoA mutase cobalamin-binding subunit
MPTTTTQFFPIRTVSSLTGVASVTLRAWERRYGLIHPARTAKGHRLYRREDIDRIHRALALLTKGMSISQVKSSLDEPAHSPSSLEGPWLDYQEQMIGAIARFDEERLEEIYNQALALFPIEQVTESLLAPLLRELGTRWENSSGSVAEEHFFGIYLRNKLGARFHHRAPGNAGPRILTACLPGEHHEVGLMLFALAAHDRGLRPVVLGANMPISELTAAAKHARCDAIALSGSIALDGDVLRKQLPRLTNRAGIPVFIGGLTSIRERDAIVSSGAIPLGTDLSSSIARIRSTLRAVGPPT